jgi:hypothetical protein
MTLVSPDVIEQMGQGAIATVDLPVTKDATHKLAPEPLDELVQLRQQLAELKKENDDLKKKRDIYLRISNRRREQLHELRAKNAQLETAPSPQPITERTGQEIEVQHISRRVNFGAGSGIHSDPLLEGWLSLGWQIMPELTIKDIVRGSDGQISHVDQLLYFTKQRTVTHVGLPVPTAAINADVEAALSTQADRSQLIIQPPATPFQPGMSFGDLLRNGHSIADVRAAADQAVFNAGIQAVSEVIQ